MADSQRAPLSLTQGQALMADRTSAPIIPKMNPFPAFHHKHSFEYVLTYSLICQAKPQVKEAKVNDQTQIRAILIKLIHQGKLDTAILTEAWRALGWDTRTSEEISEEISKVVTGQSTHR